MKRLINFLNFLGGGVLGVVDAFWTGVDAITRHRADVRPPRGQFERLSAPSHPEVAPVLRPLSQKNAGVQTNVYVQV